MAGVRLPSLIALGEGQRFSIDLDTVIGRQKALKGLRDDGVLNAIVLKGVR